VFIRVLSRAQLFKSAAQFRAFFPGRSNRKEHLATPLGRPAIDKGGMIRGRELSHSPSTIPSTIATHMNLSPESHLCDEMDRCYRELQATQSTDAARRERLDAYERALEDFLRTLSPYSRSAGDRRPVAAS
jgi:hypothetical protein